MSRYLERIRIDRYGLMEGREIGSFSPGLNVVYGPNEAGKSTVASFVGGVLFGWEEAHGVRNTYQPREGERAGSLVFADEAGGAELVVSRARNEDGLQGDTRVADDIDSATYRSLFSLSSDELRALRNTSDVTARLLTAGSGTGSSPASAFVEVEQRIAALTSHAPDAAGSIVRIGEMLEEKREEVRLAREANDLLKLQDRERSELERSRSAAAERLEALNAEVEGLKALRARIESIDGQLGARKGELGAVRGERDDFAAQLPRNAGVDEQLVALDTTAERTLRDKLDEFSDEEAKVSRAVDIARENSAASTAAYEALLEMRGDDERARAAMTRTTQAVVSIALPVIFVALGAMTFIHGRSINSLSFTALGVGLIVLAFLLAVGAIVVLLRPSRDEEASENRRKDAQWVMLQDKKKLESSLAAKAALEEEIRSFFADQGLGSANGSIRQARALLDDARVARAERTSDHQRMTSLDMRLAHEERAIEALVQEREELLRAAELPEDLSTEGLDALIADAAKSRDAHARAHEDMGMRYGELTQLLESARGDAAFDRLKYEYHQLNCRLREGKRELVTLLLAKRMLEKAISAWESHSRPEVYAQASRLFALVTDGAWTQVSMTSEGRMVATAADGSTREVRHLSLGTCQQLYLSLRVAMLMHAESVGRAIPVLADDILVHFDDDRRLAAARMLAELAGKRQVIVFTCHRETVEALRRAASGLNHIDL